jgi:hypothetical protein
VELRGIEPLTPTLPARHDRVRDGSPPFRKPVDVPVWHNGGQRRTATNVANCNHSCHHVGELQPGRSVRSRKFPPATTGRPRIDVRWYRSTNGRVAWCLDAEE